MLVRTLRHLPLIIALSCGASAVPVTTTPFSVVGGALAGNSNGTATVGRAPIIGPFDTAIDNVATALQVPLASINGLNGGGTALRGSAIFNTFFGVQSGDQLLFSALQVLPVVNNGVQFDFFASYSQVGNAANFSVVALPLTTSLADFVLTLPSAGDYVVGFGAVRTNPGTAFSTYGTTAAFLAIHPAPEFDPSTAGVPIATCVAILCLAGERRRRASLAVS
jgi:hypothetical protein